MVSWKDRRHRRPTPDEIRGWWKQWPNARIAIATGAHSGFDAVDVDGPEALEKLIALCDGNIPETIYQTTGRPEGGQHLLFKCNGHGLKSHAGGGLDLRTTNDIIVVSPSLHKSGRHYAWGKLDPIEDGLEDLADFPLGLVEYFRSASKSRNQGGCRRKSNGAGLAPRGERHLTMARLVGSWLTQGFDVDMIRLKAREWYASLPDKTDFPEAELEAQLEDMLDRWKKTGRAPEDDSGKKQKQADSLVRIGQKAELFQTPDRKQWAKFQTNGHYECWQVQSGGAGFRRWLISEYFNEVGSAPSKTAVGAALEVLESQAQYGEGRKTREVFTRVAGYDGCVYLDLADEAWRAVRISADGWEIVNNPPVCFHRSNGMLPLPEPQRGGSLDLLDGLVNLGSRTDRALILSWLLFTLNPCGPYPLLAFISEQGSGKSTTSRILRLIIDPNQAPIQALPKNERILAIAAQHSWILSFDNLSRLTGTMRDALCRMATGSGFCTRAMYKDDQVVSFWSKRPIVLNGIPEFINQSDLSDRTLCVRLPAIPADRRLADSEIDGYFRKAHPQLLGAVLDAVVLVMKKLPSMVLSEMPRMAEFAKWAAAAEAVIGAGTGKLISLLFEKNKEALLSELDSPLPQAIIKILEVSPRGIEVLTSVLLDLLNECTSHEIQKQLSWPKSGRALRGALERIKPALKAAGIYVTFLKHTQRGTPVRIESDGRLQAGDANPEEAGAGDGCAEETVTA
jgi:hypothetical protein